jgi:hypothetical protein
MQTKDHLSAVNKSYSQDSISSESQGGLICSSGS